MEGIGAISSRLSGGDLLQGALKSLGMNNRSAAMQGAMHDLKSGDLLGYHKNMFEAATGFDPGKLGMLKMAGSFGAMNPASALSNMLRGRLGRGIPKGRLKSRRSFHTPFGTQQIERRQLGGKGFFGRLKGRALESRLKRDPIFRAKFEAKVGGQFVPDGRNDGKVTVRRFKPNLLGITAGAHQALAGNLMAMTALGGLAQMQGQIANLVKGIAGQGKGQASGGIQGKEGSYVSKLGPNASFEDLVAAFMKDTMKEQQKEIKDKMNELKQLKANQKKGGGKKGKGGIGGFLGKVAPMAGKALGGVFGGPIGSMVGGMAGNMVGGALSKGGASGAKGAQSKQDYQDSRQMMMEELKNMMQKLQQMQQALSNVLNSMHQGAMNSVRNIRA
jgi:hypothetical protein